MMGSSCRCRRSPVGLIARWLAVAVVAVLATLLSSATASAATTATAETRVRASVEPAAVAVGPLPFLDRLSRPVR